LKHPKRPSAHVDSRATRDHGRGSERPDGVLVFADGRFLFVAYDKNRAADGTCSSAKFEPPRSWF
jgi:hypothetical protein